MDRQTTTEMKLEQYAAGATQPPREKRYVQQDEKICKLLENGESSLAEYIASVGHQTGQTHISEQLDKLLSIVTFTVMILSRISIYQV